MKDVVEGPTRGMDDRVEVVQTGGMTKKDSKQLMSNMRRDEILEGLQKSIEPPILSLGN